MKRSLLVILRWAQRFVLSLAWLFVTATVVADTPSSTVAVAANFTGAAKQLQLAYQQQTGFKLKLSFGSTGKLYTQIVHGAPYDVFLSADDVRPAQLAQKHLAQADTEFTYAQGRLALYGKSIIDSDQALASLKSHQKLGKVAIANPKTAPYGVAAIETLKGLNVYDAVRKKFVMGDNIAQTYQFTVTGNADIGFIALSQVIHQKDKYYWAVPAELHSPLNQNAILLNRGQSNPAAVEFLKFLQTGTAKSIIMDFGYGL